MEPVTPEAPAGGQSAWWQSPALQAGSIVAACLLVFSPVMFGGGFFWDDYILLVKNRLVLEPGGTVPHRYRCQAGGSLEVPVTGSGGTSPRSPTSTPLDSGPRSVQPLASNNGAENTSLLNTYLRL